MASRGGLILQQNKFFQNIENGFVRLRSPIKRGRWSARKADFSIRRPRCPGIHRRQGNHNPAGLANVFCARRLGHDFVW
jgi:hypothetical protein